MALPSSQPTDMYIVASGLRYWPFWPSIPFSPSKLTYDIIKVANFIDPIHTYEHIYVHTPTTLTPTTKPPMIRHIICEVFADWDASMVRSERMTMGRCINDLVYITINFIAMWRWVDKPLINNIPMEDIWEIYHDNKLWKWICRNNNI